VLRLAGMVHIGRCGPDRNFLALLCHNLKLNELPHLARRTRVSRVAECAAASSAPERGKTGPQNRVILVSAILLFSTAN